MAPSSLAPMADDMLVGIESTPVGRRPLVDQLVRFAIVGGICTAVFSAIYWALDGRIGDSWANTIALVLAAILNTGLNRRHTFRVGGRQGALRHHGQGLVILALNWVLSTGSLTGLRLLAPTATRFTELAVLTTANLGATVLRYAMLKFWVFRR